MSSNSTRRDFVKQSTSLGVAWWVGTNRAFADPKSPVERLNFACIGVQGKGSSDTNHAGDEGNIVALCDIDDVRLEKKAQRFPDAKKYNDYRKMLDEMGDEIDAVTVSTPDHSHAPASIRAMNMGKHCFCQKPLTWSVHEARKMRELAAEKQVATQMGNQGTSQDGFREAVEVVQAGTLGKVTDVHIWTNRPVWPQGTGRPTETPGVPNNIHWYLFLGPAQDRPYNPAYHPFKWRGWIDYGTGALGDMACHTANMAIMALKLFDPLAVVAESPGIVENETFPKWSIINFTFGKRGDLPPVNLTWYDGGKLPPVELFQGQQQASSGTLIVGEKGTLYSPNDYGARYVLLPKDQFVDFKAPDETMPRIPGGGSDAAHFAEFAVACRGGSPATSNFDYAGRLTETILLGNVAMRAGGELVEWDAKNLKATNLKNSAELTSREYRTGFEV